MKEEKNSIIQSSIDDVLHNSMIPYAEHVILDRALPRVEDGLKPVQRRILYTMYELGLNPDKPHKKCAKIVGDCLGKFHPHGDSSVYDALVRMAQNFNMRMTLINGHGNFGTVDGDSAAAYRYTEARLEPLALELLRDIDKNTVNFDLNFDDTLLEPNTLPGRYPNLLVNGASGIAVGLATNIPPHNLSEVIDGVIEYIDNPKIQLKELMKTIIGPDFPTGGYLIAGEELYAAYDTGRGKVKLRAKVNVEKDNNERENIIISELPYQVNKSNLLKKIVDLKEEKKEELNGIADVVDESDRAGMRAVIKLKKDARADKILEVLYKHTDLECTFGINMVAIAGGKPKQMKLLDIIGYYVNYQREVVLRRSKFELDRAKERAHILEGLIIAVKNIDEVIKIIKNSANTTEARVNLKSRFSLTEVQANAVLDLRLARLTKLEITKLEEELRELKALISKLTAIINNKKLQMEVVKDELKDIKKRYKSPRLTRIVADVNAVEKDIVKEAKEQSDNYVLGFTAGGMIKKVTEKNYNMSDKTVTEKTSLNDLLKVKLAVKTGQSVIAFTNIGNAYKFQVDIVPECRLKDKGSTFQSVIGTSVKEYPVAFFIAEANADDRAKYLFFTKSGLIKCTEVKEYILQKGSISAIKLKEGDEVIDVVVDDAATTVCYITKNGYALNIEKNDIPVQGRISAGVKGITLREGDEIAYVGQIDDTGELIVITDNGGYKRVLSYEVSPIARGGKGVKICDLNDNSVLYGGYVQIPYRLAVFTADRAYGLFTEEIPIESRPSKGKPFKGELKGITPVRVEKAN